MGRLKRTLATPPGPSVAMCIPCVPGQVPPIAEDCSAEHATVLHSARSSRRPDESEHLTWLYRRPWLCEELTTLHERVFRALINQ